MHIIQLGIALLFLAAASATVAETSEEMARLKNAQAELAQLQLQLHAAEAAADPDARIHFRYDWLRRDLAIIRRAIQAHIDASTCASTAKPCVRGDYRR